MVENAQKTPVSLLQTMCIQKGLAPEYELISVQGVSHEPTFTYRLKVKDVLVTASGSSKKKAKHSAAKSALDQLLAHKGSDTDSFLFEDITITSENINDVLVEPESETFSEKSKNKNSISILQEFCAFERENFSAPYYETVKESGMPHDRIFVERLIITRFENNVQVEEFVTIAEGKTKKLAKKDAADMMAKKLESYIIETDKKRAAKKEAERLKALKALEEDYSKDFKQSEDDENFTHSVPTDHSNDLCKSEDSNVDDLSEKVTSVPCVEPISPLTNSSVTGLFSHTNPDKDSEKCTKAEEIRNGVNEISIDSD